MVRSLKYEGAPTAKIWLQFLKISPINLRPDNLQVPFGNKKSPLLEFNAPIIKTYLIIMKLKGILNFCSFTKA